MNKAPKSLTKKLSLSAETVRALDGNALDAVNGGGLVDWDCVFGRKVCSEGCKELPWPDWMPGISYPC